MRTLTAITLAVLLSTGGSAFAQVKDDGAANPSSNKGSGPKFQDGSALSGESNTKAAPGTGQNSSSAGTVKGTTDNDPGTMKGGSSSGSSIGTPAGTSNKNQ